MSPQPTLHPAMLLITTLIPVIAGVWLVWRGIKGRHVGETPYCAGCGYNLTGLPSERCPECGSDLAEPRAVVHGERRARRAVIVVGLLCFVAAGGWGWRKSGEVEWYHHIPLRWVLDDLKSPSMPVSSKAWDELRRRDSDLSVSQRRQVIDLLLTEQAAATPGRFFRRLSDLAAGWYLDGAFTAKQADTWFRQMFKRTLTVRPRVVRGDPVPYTLAAEARGPSTGSGLGYRAKASTIYVDGKDMCMGTGGGTGCSFVGGGSSSITFPFDEVGPHVATVNVNFKIHRCEEWKVLEDEEPLHEHEVSLSCPFEILETESEGYFTLIDDPSLIPELKKCIRPERIRIKPGTHYYKPLMIDGDISIEPPPINVAFDVIARVDGKEIPLGTMWKPKGKTGNGSVQKGYDGPTFETCDIILHSSEQVARNTVELFEIWDGELVYEDVPVGVDPAATAPAEASTSTAPPRRPETQPSPPRAAGPAGVNSRPATLAPQVSGSLCSGGD